jgi:putative transposase
MFSDGELWAYFYNLSDGIKRHILEQNPAIARRWKFPDAMPVWEFIERIDQFRAHRRSATPDFAGRPGLEPITTPVESLQSNEMAEAFVRTVKRD